MDEIIFGLDFKQFEDKPGRTGSRCVGKGLSVLLDHGVYKGDGS